MLTAGTAIELEIEEGEVAAFLEGTVVVATDNRVAVQVALDRRSGVEVQRGGAARVHVPRGAAVDSFTSTITELTREPGMLIVALTPPSSGEVDRRERAYFRLAVQLPVDVQTEDGTTVRAETVDISGGGVGAICPTPFDMGTSVDLTIHLDDDRPPVTVRARVTRVHQLPQPGERRYRIGFDYARIGLGDRDRLTGFIFARQREMRRRGLL